MIRLNSTAKTVVTIVGVLGLCYGLYIYINSTDFVDSTSETFFSPPLIVVSIIVLTSSYLVIKDMQELKSVPLLVKINPIKLWPIVFKGTPKWMQVIVIASIVFGLVNVIVHGNLGAAEVMERGLTEGENIVQKANEFKFLTSTQIFYIGICTGISCPRSIV